MLRITLKNDSGFESQLHYQSNRIRRFSKLTPSVVSINQRFLPERERVERFISSVFMDRYNATFSQHYPTLMSVRDSEDRILAAVGFRMAAQEPLFLEQYLDQPVEAEISRVFTAPAPRQGIVEVGNLASLGQGGSIFLFTALLAYLKQQGYTHMAFTATAHLHEYFTAIGVEPRLIRYADQSRLPDGGASWGSYYDTMPRLIGGDIHYSNERLRKFLGVELQTLEKQLRTRLHPRLENPL